MANETPNSPRNTGGVSEHDRRETISNFKVACIIGMTLMPAGFILDYAVYPSLALQFLRLRFLSSVLIGVFLTVLLTPLGRKHYRFLGISLFMLPASFIAWMINASEGAASPYYAGLNLVLLVLAFVLHWTFRESLSAARARPRALPGRGFVSTPARFARKIGASSSTTFTFWC